MSIKTINLIFLIALLLSVSCNNNSGIDGNSNTNNSVIIADEIEKVEIISSKKMTSASLDFMKKINFGTSIDYIIEQLGEPITKQTVDNGVLYKWKLDNLELKLISNDNTTANVSISFMSTNNGSLDIYYPSNYLDQVIDLPPLGKLTFKDIDKFDYCGGLYYTYCISQSDEKCPHLFAINDARCCAQSYICWEFSNFETYSNINDCYNDLVTMVTIHDCMFYMNLPNSYHSE